VRYAAPPSFTARGTPEESAYFSIEDPGGNRLGFTASREPARSEK
jgi:extradiol dioxygenase family protein